jgi:predicted ATPase
LPHWRIVSTRTSRSGRHGEVVPELEALVAEHPLRERFAGQLMLALYRCGRQADASRAYHATRAVLVEELGMQPGPPLRELHQRVLDQDPTLAPAPRVTDAEVPRPASSPAARAPAHNLPVELTSFIGRERELNQISALLSEARLLTLTGAGGSGKTRLALRAGRQVAAGYPDGVWLVELAALADRALVGKSLAITLGIRQEDGRLIDTLKRQLRSAQMLVIIDNCEHLAGACAELSHELLSASEGLRIVATSREPLNVTGEVTWLVPGLSLPDSDSVPRPDELERYAAPRLFTERARSVKPGFAVGGDAEAIARLCARLDGMPLAIELAAARVRTLSPGEILERLDDRFHFLTAGSRDALPRQRTLLATVEWSHDLLSSTEQTLFRRLSVFAGGWTLADAEQVCADNDLPAKEIVEVVCGLVDKSLVVADSPPGGPTRYRLLETLREYAAGRLGTAGEQQTIRRRHFDYYLELADRAHEEKLLSGSDAGMRALAPDFENLRAGLAFAQAADPHGLLRLATAMEGLWLAGNLGEGRSWLEQALERTPEPTLERARALQAAVSLASHQQDHPQARAWANESLALSSSLNDRAGAAWARQSLGHIAFLAGEHPTAVRHLKQSLAMHEANGVPFVDLPGHRAHLHSSRQATGAHRTRTRATRRARARGRVGRGVGRSFPGVR